MITTAKDDMWLKHCEEVDRGMGDKSTRTMEKILQMRHNVHEGRSIHLISIAKWKECFQKPV